MFEMIRAFKRHGRQAIPDIRKARLPDNYVGFPLLDETRCAIDCDVCCCICFTKAIKKTPLRIDLGNCIFCGECAEKCPSQAIKFNPFYQTANTNRKGLEVISGTTTHSYLKDAVRAKQEIKKIFGRSLKLRQVSAGGCNGCEMELSASNNVNFDMGRFGIDFVASPRHADGLVITGPCTQNMAKALMDAYRSMSRPKIVMAVGACAISGGVFKDSDCLDRSFFNEVPVDLFVPGCPPHPFTFIHAVLDFGEIMKITFLGTNGWYDSQTGSTICILVQTLNYDIIFDAGSGFNKVSDHITGDKPVYLFLSHLHLDHLYGLHTLVRQRFSKGLNIVILDENRYPLEAYLNKPFTVPIKDLSYKVTLIAVPRDLAEIPFKVETLPVLHPDPTMGVRITLEGKTIVFSGDTGPCDNLTTLARNADVFITDCAFRSGEKIAGWSHLNPETAAMTARDAKVRALYLTHFDASRYLTFADRDVAESLARIIFLSTVATRDGMVIEV